MREGSREVGEGREGRGGRGGGREGGRAKRQQTHGVMGLSGFDEICTCGGTERDGRGETRSTTAFSVTEPLSFVHARTQTHRHGRTV